jgi:hypothetical protein
MTRLLRSSLSSTPLAVTTILALTLLGCGGGSGEEKDGGMAGAGKGGGSAKGGSGGTTAAKGGSGGSSANNGGNGGNGVGGVGATGGVSAGGSGPGGGSVGGSGPGGSSVAGAAGSVAGAAGSVAGAAGSVAGAAGSIAGAAGSVAGAGGSGPNCVTDQPCTLAGNVKGVCANNVCTACVTDSDSACQTTYGSTYICVAGDCVVGNCHQNSNCSGKLCNTTSHMCESCATGSAGDNACATAYGQGHICLGGTCMTGTCHNNVDCGTTGQICNASSQCVSCGSDDAACVASYGAGYICVAGGCVTGTCHTGAQCINSDAGKACNASHVCAACADDAECVASYGSGHICSSSGACIEGNCKTNAQCGNGQVCLANKCAACTSNGQCASGQVCLPTGACTSGNCLDATDCSDATKVCLNNSCSSCTTDGQCVSARGINHICEGGACVNGNCRAKGDCQPTNQICNTTAKSCQSCTLDSDCTGEYGDNHICLGGVCVTGNCHTAAACSTGQVCNQTTHSCGGCGTSDAACQDTVGGRGAGYICDANACIAGNCHDASNCNDTTKVCKSHSCGMCTGNADCTAAYGNNHICVAGACISGDCQTSSDCGGNQLCNTSTHLCEACAGATPAAADAKCMADTVYGAMHICLAGQCVAGNCHDTSGECMNGQICGITTAHTCGGCGSSNTACKNDTTYGSGTICLAGGCVTGDCHDNSSECNPGKLCGVSTPHTCGDCSGTPTAADAECTGDSQYGAGTICYQGNCQVGTCHANSQDCTGVNTGFVCGNGGSATRCGPCTSDAQCKADSFYGPTFVCNTTAGPNQGKCVSASCANNNNACSANSGDFCCSSTCTAGNCCGNSDCNNNPTFGNGYTCTNHTCTKCDAIAGNTYYVDPINGNDLTATGSGKSSGAANAGCSFQTITKAMQVIGTGAGTGTKVVIVGSGTTPTGLAAADSLPITVQPNVTVTTTGGAITITLPAATSQANPANNSGFILSSDGSGIAGDAAAPLILEGNGNTSGIAVAVTAGTVSLTNLTIQNTRAHAISITGGTLNIGAGVTVKNAGTTGILRDGLAVSGGVANVTVPSGSATTSFTGNTQFGIDVTALGSVNITGVAVTPPNGNGTVVVSSNGVGNNNTAGLQIRQTAGATLATNTITGLVAWNNGVDGARLSGGSKIKIRNSVFGANLTDGIRVVQGTGGNATQQRDLSAIDLGNSTSAPADYGKNYLQTPLSVGGRNQTAGLCVTLGGAASGAGILNAAGNYLVFGTGGTSQVDCSATSQTVTKGTCTGGNSLGVANGTTVTVALNQCN